LRRRALVAALSCVAAFAPAAAAQDGAPAPTAPSLQILTADLRQIGADLQLGLQLSRTVTAAELERRRGRMVCMILSPAEPSRRRVCVSRRDGRLSATLAPIDRNGVAVGPMRVLRSARVGIERDVLTVRVPAAALRVTLGRPVTWRAVLRWRAGGPCEAEPDPLLACVQVVPPTGEQRLDTTAPRQPSPTSSTQLRLLATGDSMIQIVDGYLKSSLARRRATTVRSDARISTGISKLALLDWTRTAHGQARDFKPDVTVMFLGANDGFPMRTPTDANVACCNAGWVAEYARRVESMMRSYRRGGRSLVYWLTLPTPRRGDFARIYRAVNDAIRRAAATVGDGVHVIDLVPVFSPGDRFRQTITFRGRTVDARQDDGIHLSNAGASVAATLVVDRLREDRALPHAR
jgi:lysophospholipase L1-like esterase